MDSASPEIQLGATVTRRGVGQKIWDACIDLANREKAINRKALSELTGLKISIVDDHVERMVANGYLQRRGYGILEVVEQFPAPRAISKTVLPNGQVKLEIGDTVLDLTPKESRTLSQLFGPELFTVQEIEAGNFALARMAEVAIQVRELRMLVEQQRAG